MATLSHTAPSSHVRLSNATRLVLKQAWESPRFQEPLPRIPTRKVPEVAPPAVPTRNPCVLTAQVTAQSHSFFHCIHHTHRQHTHITYATHTYHIPCTRATHMYTPCMPHTQHTPHACHTQTSNTHTMCMSCIPYIPYTHMCT